MSYIEAIEITVANVDDPGTMDRSPEKPSSLDLCVSTDPSKENPCDPSVGTSPQLVVVKIRSSEGIDGHGFGWGVKGGMRVAHAIAEVYRPELVGEDPFDREKLWHKAHRADRFGGNVPFTAYGPLDVALWDIAAQSAGVPLYKFIGAYRDKVTAYASSPYLEKTTEYA